MQHQLTVDKALAEYFERHLPGLKRPKERMSQLTRTLDKLMDRPVASIRQSDLVVALVDKLARVQLLVHIGLRPGHCLTSAPGGPVRRHDARTLRRQPHGCLEPGHRAGAR